MKISLIEELLTPAVKFPHEVARKLVERYGSFIEIAESELDSIADSVGEGGINTALYIKLAVALASRRVCDDFKFGKKHTDAEVENYLKHLFFGVSVETVYVLSIDKSGKAVACDKVTEGTVNLSSVMPRKMLEIAKRRSAREVIIAHNHPGGYAVPSNDDISATTVLHDLFLSSGIKLLKHYVVAGSECATV